MHKILSILAAIAAVLALLIIGQMIYAQVTDRFSDGRGMAILFFELWGAILIGISIVLALIARFIARRKGERPHGANRLALGISVPLLVIGLIGMFVA